MIIFNEGGIRVLQHPYLQYFQVQKWCLGDCSRSYGQSYDYRTVLETRKIEEVNAKVAELTREGGE
jgi:hypothetical protein